MLEKLEKFKNFAEQNSKMLTVGHLISGVLGVIVMLGVNYTLGAFIFVVSGALGSGPRFLSHGLYSSSGLLMLYSSMMVGIIFGLAMQIMMLVVGSYLMFSVAKR